MPFCDNRLGYPRESRREMVSEGRTGATWMPLGGRMARDAKAVTEQGGAAIGHADWTHESLNSSGGGRRDSVAESRKPGAACHIGCTPPHAAIADRSDACPQDECVCSVDRDAGIVTDHGGAAIGHADATHESILCRSAGRSASFACAGGRSRLPYSLYAAACCGGGTFSRLPEAAEGCPQGEHSWLAAKRGLYTFRLVGRDQARPTNGFSPEGPTPKVGTCTVPGLPDEGPIVPGGSDTCHRMPVGWP